MAVVGEPNSGKTVFSLLLRAAVAALARRALYVSADPNDYPPGAFPGKVLKALAELRSFPGVVVVDVGGAMTEENGAIVALCDYAVVVSRSRVEEWAEWAAKRTKVFAVFVSVYDPERRYDYSEPNAVWHLDMTAYLNGEIPPPTLSVILNLAHALLSGGA